jgi:glutamyl-tRNA synthetase
MTVRTRIAPSPTGDPHVGTAYIALFNYCFARQQGGQFLLRIEDTDQTRSAPEYERAIMEALRWLSIDWDEGPDKGGPCGPYRQSERKEIYRQHVDMLLAKGEAYRCFCTAERLDEMRKRNLELKRPTTGYDGHCRALSETEAAEKLAQGLPFVVRLKMPSEGDTVVKDRLRGEVRYPNYQQDDQVLLKSDGFPTYHLANVVDDHLMGITHVIRAEEWIPSTPKHIRLYEAFGWNPPEFVHMPLLRNKDRSKISKRKNPTSIMYYKRIGIIPEAMLNFLALMGYSLGEDREKFSLDELVQAFDLGRVSLGEPVFDLEKMHWLNGIYIRDLPEEKLTDLLMERVLSRDFVRQVVPLIRERIRRLDEFIPKADFFFASEMTYDAQLLIGKGMTVEQMIDALGELAEALDGLRSWTTPLIEETIRLYCERSGLKPKAIFMPVRIAMTGRAASPPLFESMEVIGKPLCQTRMREAIARLKELHKQKREEHGRTEGQG